MKLGLVFDLLWGAGNEPGTEPKVQVTAQSLMTVLGLANDAEKIDPLYTSDGIEPMKILAECGIFSNRIDSFYVMCGRYVTINTTEGASAKAAHKAACEGEDTSKQNEIKAKNWAIIDLLTQKTMLGLLHATKLKDAKGQYLLSKELLNDAIDRRCFMDTKSILSQVYQSLPGLPRV